MEESGGFQSKIETRLVNRRKTETMVRAGSMLSEHSQMIGRGIAAMDGKSVLRKLSVEFLHDPVTSHLGQDAGGRDTQTQSISTDKGSLLDGESFGRKTIHKGMGNVMSVFLQFIQSTLH